MISFNEITAILGVDDAKALISAFDAFRSNPEWHAIMFQTKAGDIYHGLKRAVEKQEKLETLPGDE